MKIFKRGFTLLELLVVIGIIGLLVGLGAVSFSTAQKKARDAKRRGDVQAHKNAFEQYYSVCNFTYPSAVAASYTCSSPNITVATGLNVRGPFNNANDDYVYTAGSPGTICTDTNAMESPVSTFCLTLQQ